MKKWIWILVLMLSLSVVCASAEGTDEVFSDAPSKAEWVVEHYTDSSMTAEEKALALHDWLILNAYYDTTFSPPNRFQASGALLDGPGVCDSYAKAYVLLLSKAGIEAKRVEGAAVKADGSTESHAWNLVKLDDQWYQVDVTWDDPVNDAKPTEKVSGLEHRLYFKASKRFMNEEHRPSEESAALIDELVPDDTTETLPTGVDHSKRYDLPELHLIGSSGGSITGDTVKGKDMILVYGRIACLNTRAFLSDISPFMDLMKRRGVQVTVALYDDPSYDEMKAFASDYPGIVCTKLAEDDYSMWAGMSLFGNEGNSVTFPVIFLKNRNNKLTYYSTNYVEHSLAVVSGALDMAGEPDEEEPEPVDPEPVDPEPVEPEPVEPEPVEPEPAEPELVGWNETDAGWTFIRDDGTKAVGWLQNGNTWYYMNADGIMQTGWVGDGSNWYYMNASGAMQTDWVQSGGAWYYMNASGIMQTGWVSNGGNWYYMNGSGVMQTGWVSNGGNWYYMNASGAMQTGWLQSGESWYYLKQASGAMATGWTMIQGTWYYFDPSGVMTTGWTEIGGQWYYFRSSGTMVTGWFEDTDAENALPEGQRKALWYWFDDNGAMATGWKEIDGQWEMFADSGVWLYTAQ